MIPSPIWTADPNRAFALVVGIERYEMGESWNLDGPAADAVRFVNWLRSRDVPAANIWLHLSPLNLAESVGALTDPAVAVHKATRESIHNRVTDLLNLPGELLYLFWGGHGSITSSRDRRLYYADARAGDRQTLQVGSLLDFLESEKMKIKRQIAFIDACANMTSDPRQLVADQFSGDRATSDVVQSFFFAAAPGQKARNDAVLRGGVFSRHVQDALDAVPGSFPPNPVEIIQTVRNLLDQSGQIGVSYESRDWAGNIRTSPGATEGPYLRYAARKLRLPVGQLDQLYQAFGRCPALQTQQLRDDLANNLAGSGCRPAYRPDEVLTAPPTDLLSQFTAAFSQDRGKTFRGAFEQFEPVSQAADEVSGLLHRLCLLDEARVLVEDLDLDFQPLLAASLPASNCRPDAPIEDLLGESLNSASYELPVFYEFLTRIANNFTTDSQALRQFVNNCSARARDRIRTKLDEEAAGLPHILEVRPDRHSIVWYRGDGHFMGKKELEFDPQEKAVQQKLIEILEDIWARGNFQLSIEVYLQPKALHWTPDAWMRIDDDFGGSERLCTRHPMVVHFVKRWTEPGTYAISWRPLCDKIRHHLNQKQPPWFSFLQRGENSGTALAADLSAGKRGPLLAFDFPLTIEAGKVPDELVAAIKAGAPFVCWLRTPPEDWQLFRDQVDALVPPVALTQHFDEIPQRIFEARIAAANQPDPPATLGGDLTLLWDDARISPFENKYRPPA